MKALIEIEADGVLCGNCFACDQNNDICLAFHRQELKYKKNEVTRWDDLERLPQCLAATARAQELLDSEAELKRMKAAETYENERMP